jgi:hypothetical protein
MKTCIKCFSSISIQGFGLRPSEVILKHYCSLTLSSNDLSPLSGLPSSRTISKAMLCLKRRGETLFNEQI